MSTRSRRCSLIAAIALLSVGAAACGDDDDDGAGSGTTPPGADTTAAVEGTTTEGTEGTAVGGTEGTTAGTESTTAATEGTATDSITMGSVPEDFSIVYVPGLTGNPFYNTVACGAEKKAEELGVDFTYQGAPEFDVAAQSAIVSALVGEEPDAIMISITDQDAMIPPLTEAKDAGITLIGIDGDLSDRSILSTNIQSDNLVGGALAARSLVEAVGEDVGGDVIGISNDPGNPIGEAREKGFTDELSKYPGFNYLGTQYSQNAQAEAATIVSTTASSNDNLVGVYTMATNNTEGAVTGLREAGKTSDEVRIVGYDVSEPILAALEAGDITGLVVQFPYGAGQKGVESAVAIANGQEVPRDQPTDFVFATPDNLETDEVQQFIYKLECD